MMLPKMNAPKFTNAESVPTTFLRMVHDDILRCETYLSGEHDEKEGSKLHNELVSKYHAYISDFDSTLNGYNYVAHVVDMSYLGIDSIDENIESMKNKLIAFEANGCRNAMRERKISSESINIENNLSAVQTQSFIMDFDAARNQIESMTGLSEKETQETLDKVNEIKEIVQLKDSPKTKWQKLKPILAWIADKSVDVGVTLLPLILKLEIND